MSKNHTESYQMRFKLKQPIKHGASTITTITLREMVLGDMAGCTLPLNGQLEIDSILRVLSRISGLSESIVNNISVVDAGPIIGATILLWAEMFSAASDASALVPKKAGKESGEG